MIGELAKRKYSLHSRISIKSSKANPLRHSSKARIQLAPPNLNNEPYINGDQGIAIEMISHKPQPTSGPGYRSISYTTCHQFIHEMPSVARGLVLLSRPGVAGYIRSHKIEA